MNKIVAAFYFDEKACQKMALVTIEHFPCEKSDESLNVRGFNFKQYFCIKYLYN